MRGIDITFGNLFYPKENSCIPLFELSLLHPEIKTNGAINMSALLNAVFKFYPEYTSAHNKEHAEYKHGTLIQENCDTGTEFIEF